MSKIAVIYWSGTGNTEAMADLVANAAAAAGASVDKFTASEFNVSSAGDYTGFALGCPAMGAEQLEESEFNIIQAPHKGECLYKCGNERYDLLVTAPAYKEKLFGKAGGK